MKLNLIARSILLLGCGMQALPALAADAASFEAIGRMGDGGTRASGLNKLGQVVGTAVSASGSQSAFLYSGGTLIDLSAAFVAVQSSAAGINDAGQIVGWSRLSVFGLQSGFVMTDAGVSYVSYAGYATSIVGIDNAGRMVGNRTTSGGATTALYGYMQPDPYFFALANGTTAAAINNGSAVGNWQADGGWVGGDPLQIPIAFTLAVNQTLMPRALNATRSIVGTTTGSRAFATDAGGNVVYLPGSGAAALGINDAGLIVGQSTTASGALHAWVWGSGQGYDLNALAPAGWELNTAAAVNNGMQIAGTGTHDGHSEAYLLSLNPTWKGGDGNWTTGSRWGYGGLASLGQAPSAAEDAVIGVGGSTTVTVAASVAARSVSLSAADGQLATLNLGGGSVTTTRDLLVGANGVLAGSGRVTGDTSVLAGATVSLQAGDSMQFVGGSFTNAGQVRALGSALAGAQFTATGPVLNDSGARWHTQNAILDFRGGFINRGQLSFVSGSSNVFGKVRNEAGGQIVLSGSGNTAFYDTVEVQGGAELRVSAGSTATFFGTVLQRTGSFFTGAGTSFYEGGLSVGDSPGFGQNAGDVHFGANNVYVAEIGGSTACTSACSSDDALKNHGYDRYLVGGHLTLGGTLKLVSWDGYVLQAGESLALFDAGDVSGSFSAIDASGLLLAAGTVLDVSQLEALGMVTVQTVPEPGSASLFASGMAGLALLRRRWRRASRGA